ncbi:DNA helicase [Alloscardovia macacae]|uniref:DNA helicase n=1 Tax=Alloscardovia macacae TaxID=1160091 RepID=A0A1Y2T380_9BIFI|nr:SNF2-related protein [Alloscardovia macacae]OTA29855.1 DNA helicase [Alloscardovia macacae]
MLYPEDYAAKYHAYQLERTYTSSPEDSVGPLAGLLFDAQVEPKPHQIDAALFALHSPFRKGVILADEVGLGKTIEAGIVISQFWAERKRNILIISPSSLRQQWRQELSEKFALPSLILDRFQLDVLSSPSAEKVKSPRIFICSYEFANAHTLDLAIPWDLVVCDEAHRLRSHWTQRAKIAQAVSSICSDASRCIMLTATPLQNRLEELYGIVSVFDPDFFQSFDAFKERYVNHPDDLGNDDLAQRVSLIAKRTLRKDAQKYIRYTNRIPLTFAFIPSEAEQKIYDLINNYLQRPFLYAFPQSQRFLSSIIIRKRLGSSPLALATTLEKISHRLESELRSGRRRNNAGSFLDDADILDDFKEISPDGDDEPSHGSFSHEDRLGMEDEIAELREYAALARTITQNAKATKLLEALEQGFSRLRDIGAPQKAIIFTDSTVTQQYLAELLRKEGWKEGLVLFNGTNTSEEAQHIYTRWLKENDGSDIITGVPAADRRKALVDEFRENGRIMIATEAAAEGINLQFCSMLVNYDLPWNPQRVEQRIGRIHRFGQKHNVIIVNFSNKGNRAEERILELLTEKFQLFTSIFGASDEVLGSIEDGVDFERSILSILDKCKTAEEIDKAFDEFETRYATQISKEMKKTRAKVFDNLDPHVRDKLKSYDTQTSVVLNSFERLLLKLTRYELRNYADFSDDALHFYLRTAPQEKVPLGEYYFKKSPEKGAHQYRYASDLCQWVISCAQNSFTPSAHVTFSIDDSDRASAPLKKLRHTSGILSLDSVSFTAPSSDQKTAVPTESHLVASAYTESGSPLDAELIHDLLDLHAIAATEEHITSDACDQSITEQINELHMRIQEKNASYLYEQEMLIDSRLADLRATYDAKIREAQAQSESLEKASRRSSDQMERLKLLKESRKLRNAAEDMEDDYRAQRKLLREKSSSYLEKISDALHTEIHRTHLYTIRWEIL